MTVFKTLIMFIAAFGANASLSAAASVAAPVSEGPQINQDSVVIAGKTFVRLSGRELENAVAGKTFWPRQSSNVHSERQLFGKGGAYADLNSRYGGNEGKYRVVKDVIVVTIQGLTPTRYAVFRASDGSMAIGWLFDDGRINGPSEVVERH